jgi:signal transduction histidine kinase
MDRGSGYSSSGFPDTRIRSEAERADALIAHLLTSHAEAGKPCLDRHLELIGPLVEEVREVNLLAARRKRIHLDTDVRRDLPGALVDRLRVLQVLNSLVGNSIEITPNDGHVCVSARCEAGCIVLAVSDTGPGLSVEKQDRRSHSCHRGRAQLGLALAKRIVDEHGGELRVDSAVGEGTTFTFTLPPAQEAR